MNRVGFTELRRRELELTRRAMEGIRKIPSVHLLGSEKPEEHCGILTFTVDGVHPHDVSEILASDGVAIRAGPPRARVWRSIIPKTMSIGC